MPESQGLHAVSQSEDGNQGDIELGCAGDEFTGGVADDMRTSSTEPDIEVTPCRFPGSHF